MFNTVETARRIKEARLAQNMTQMALADAMGVSFTLVTGSERALLVDTGYGLEDVAAYIRTVTSLPVDVLLTHGHHDHALGARWFPSVQMSAEDLPVFRLRTAAAQRERVLEQAAAKGVSAPDDFRTAPIADPEPIRFDRDLAGFPCRTYSLGSLDVLVMQVPGHTPGSVCYLIENELFTGDTLFEHGWGRTDLPGGNEQDMYASLRRIMPLARQYPMHAGH